MTYPIIERVSSLKRRLTDKVVPIRPDLVTHLSKLWDCHAAQQRSTPAQRSAALVLLSLPYLDFFWALTRKSEVMTGVALFFRRHRLLAPCTPSDILGNFLSSSELYCTKETRQLHEGNQALAPNRCNPLLRYIKALDDMSAVRPLPLPHLEFRNLPGSRTQILNYNVLFESDT